MIIYIEIDDVLCDFSEAYNQALINNPDIKYPQSQYGFFTEIKPKEGAIDATQRIESSKDFETYILTAPSTRNPLCYTEKRVWIEKWLGYSFVKKLIICSNKGLLKGDILIDDNISGRGQENFEGRIIHFGSSQFPDWSSVIKELKIST